MRENAAWKIPYDLAGLRLRSRVVRSATNDHLGYADGTVSGEQLEMYRKLAEHGIGLIITGHLSVSAEHRADPFQPLISDDSFVPGIRRIAETVHGAGGLVCAQISHAGSKGPNPISYHCLTRMEWGQLEQDFIRAAFRARQAGMDAVQVHLAHGYLLSELLDDGKDEPGDAYGGSDEARLEPVLRILAGIREACGEDFPVLVKMNANHSAKSDYRERLAVYAAALEEAGVCAIELSGLDFAARKPAERLYYLREAVDLKKNLRVPLILVGGIASPEDAEAAFSAGADLISMCRPFIAEPEILSRWASGEREGKCLHCNRCFRVFKEKYRRCVFAEESGQLRRSFGGV